MPQGHQACPMDQQSGKQVASRTPLAQLVQLAQPAAHCNEED